MTKVQSRLPAPVALRIFTWIPDQVDGRVARALGGPVVVRPGLNEIDDEFWRRWYAAHGDTLLAQHLAVEQEELNPT
jgi:hypothetical protein